MFEKTTTIITVLLIAQFGLCQEELNEEDNWKLYPGSENSRKSTVLENDTTAIDSSLTYKGPAFVEVIQDYRIKQLLEKDKYLNEKHDPPQIDGYRIKIYFGSGSESQKEANQAKARFLETYSDEKIYVNWDTPNYTTTVGNFRSKLEAEKFLKEISGQFPEGFIVPSKIDLPEIKD